MVYKRHLNYLHLALANFSYNENLPLYLIFHLLNPNLELENTLLLTGGVCTSSVFKSGLYFHSADSKSSSFLD